MILFFSAPQAFYCNAACEFPIKILNRVRDGLLCARGAGKIRKGSKKKTNASSMVVNSKIVPQNSVVKCKF